MLSTFGIPMDELAEQRYEACQGEGHYIEKTADSGDRECSRECYGVCTVCGAEFVGVETISGGDEFGNAEYSVDPDSWVLEQSARWWKCACGQRVDTHPSTGILYCGSCGLQMVEEASDAK